MASRGIVKGGSYTCLGEVYQVTTVPYNMFKSPNKLKKAMKFGGKSSKNLIPLLNQCTDMKEVLMETSTELKDKPMPSISLHEEMSLLRMDDIELRSVDVQFPNARLHAAGGAAGEGGAACGEARVRTDCGELLVAVQGDRAKPAILTYHDIGLNYMSFQPFFGFIDMRALLENFCVYHMNAPGQEEGAPSLPEDYVYPTMDELARQVNYVLGHFGIKSFIGFGVGAGANILARFALAHPQQVDALVLVNCTSNQAGWIEWAYQKFNSRLLRTRGMTYAVLDYLMWHHFGRMPEERNQDLTHMYRSYFTRNVNATNLALFIDSYVRRNDLAIGRDADTLKVPVLNITGALSPHMEDTVTFNSRLNPSTSTWMKLSDCGLPLEEHPEKLAEAFRLFLQGEGYVLRLRSPNAARIRSATEFQ